MGGRLYVAGGSAAPVPSPALRRCEVYDPVSDSWARIASLPEARCLLALACLDGALYALGGAADDGEGYSEFSTSPPWRYDATADAWGEAYLARDSAEMRAFASGWASL